MEKPGYIVGHRTEHEAIRGPQALPPEQPLLMPRQLLHAQSKPARSSWSLARAWSWVVRILLFGLTLALAAFGTHYMYGVMSDDMTAIQWVFLVLFSINFTWISFAACQALLGFLFILKRDIFGRRKTHNSAPKIRTAVLVPVYNEEPHRVSSAIAAMAADLVGEAPGVFSFFILSDTNNPTAWLREEKTFFPLIENSDPLCPVYYRHRRDNHERKAGNISDWVMRWGGGFDAMLVLDADSIMSASTMVEMARRIEADPGLGLLQTLPSIVWGTTLYARLQQFANRLYGPVFGNGLSVWHGEGSNFWGHNAIIRTSAFASSAHLPILSGKPPFGGHVISHDFIEAALLRRSGWSVRLDTDLQESFEEPPPSVSDVLVRDRRWCQGNLQHSRFLFARGLAMTTRIHILSGIMAYVSAVFWLLLLSTGLVLAVQASLTRPEYFAQPSLFPNWPVFDSERAIKLFVISMGIVLLPKMLGWATAILNLKRCLRYGGPILLTFSVIIEVLLSALVAPIMMLAQSRMVWEILTGGDSGWKPQRRADGSIPFAEAWHKHIWHTVIGVLAAALTAYLHFDLFLWSLPVTAGLMLSASLSWVSGMRGPGQLFKSLGLLRTPEERREPAILAQVRGELKDIDEESETTALAFLQTDNKFCDWHCAQLQALNTDSMKFNPDLVLASAKAERTTSIEELSQWLNPAETMAFLHSPDLIRDVLKVRQKSSSMDAPVPALELES